MHVSPSDILVVIPPPRPSRRDRIEATEQIGVSVHVGPYEVTGSAHVRKGDRVDDEFRGRHLFLPLTRATIVRDGNADRVDVAIVNLAASTRFGPTP